MTTPAQDNCGLSSTQRKANKLNLVCNLSLYKVMRTINVHQAKTNLSKLLSDVELGEEIIIANRGVPVAKLIPFHGVSANRLASLGQDRGRFVVPEDFNNSLPEDVLAGFEGVEA